MIDEGVDIDLERTKLKVQLENYSSDFVDSLTYETLEALWDNKAKGYDTRWLLEFLVEFLQERIKQLCP